MVIFIFNKNQYFDPKKGVSLSRSKGHKTILVCKIHIGHMTKFSQ